MQSLIARNSAAPAAAALLLGVLLPALTINAFPAHAEEKDCPEGQTLVQTSVGSTCVRVTDPGSPPEQTPGNTGNTGGAASCYDQEGEEVDCVDFAGWVWFHSQNCYASRLGEQPVDNPEHPGWEGNDPAEGQVYMCRTSGEYGITPTHFFFVANGDAPIPDPAALAQQAVDQLPFAVPEISMAPQDPQRTTVGLETWLWLPEGQMDALSLTVSAGNTSVTVTAAPSRVDWDLSEGSTSCSSAGRPWVKGMSGSEQTDCSYTFNTLSRNQPKGKYPVSATIIYDITWTCSGTCLSDSGELGEVPSLTSGAAIEVIERQTVVKRH